jgi:Putative adhesin
MYSKFNLIKQLSVYFLISFAFSFNACGGIEVHSEDDLQLIQEKTFKISPGKNLLVDITSGDVKVTHWDKAEVSVKILGNENAMEKMDFTLEGNENQIKVIGEKKSSISSWFSSTNVNVEIKVPTQFNLDINTAGGDIKCGGIKGKAELNTSGGDIWADKFSGNLISSTSGGDIFLFCFDASIEAETSGGDIKLEYAGENRGINLSTSGGDIDIKLPKDYSTSIELSTSGGDVSCSLNMSNVKKSSGSRLIADLNGGGEKLLAQTSGGDITVTEK